MKAVTFQLSKGHQHVHTHTHSCVYAFVRTFLDTIQALDPYSKSNWIPNKNIKDHQDEEQMKEHLSCQNRSRPFV